MKNVIKYISLMILMLGLGACTQSGPSTKINVNMTDFAFTPNQFTVPAGEQITLHVSHNGVVEHDFIVMKLGTDAGTHFNTEDEPNIYWQIKVQPGESQTVTMTAPDEPGVYQVVCGMAGHIEAGMVGALEVVEE